MVTSRPRAASQAAWRPAPPDELPTRAWFGIERTVRELELATVCWSETLERGTFATADAPWERRPVGPGGRGAGSRATRGGGTP